MLDANCADVRRGRLGFYRGWFILSGHTRDTGSHKVDVKLTVDPVKLKEDAESAQDKK